MTHTSFSPALLTLTLTLALSGVSAAQDEVPVDLTKAELRHQGRQRTFYYHGKVNRRSAVLKPVLFVLHGGGGNAARTSQDSGYNAIADRDGLLVVYPEGIEGNWNDGRGTVAKTGVDVTDVDDVGFFKKLFDYTARNLKGDPQRFYVTGMSNGGTMSYRLALELGERIAAIAPVIANMPIPLTTQQPTVPMPVLIMNGTADPLMLWDGGDQILSTPQSVRFWLEANRGQGWPRASSVHLPDLDRRDDSTVEVTTFSGLSAPVVLYTIHGGGHTFPGGQGSFPKQIVGAHNMDIVGAEEIWAFFSEHQRD